eukprot:scaffold391526_cov22-Prasinocladus_malaysianus.AAC.1
MLAARSSCTRTHFASRTRTPTSDYVYLYEYSYCFAWRTDDDTGYGVRSFEFIRTHKQHTCTGTSIAA